MLKIDYRVYKLRVIYSAQSSALKNFFQKKHHKREAIDTSLPAFNYSATLALPLSKDLLTFS